MNPDIISIHTPTRKPVARLTPDGKLRGSLILRLTLFFILTSIMAGLVGGLAATLLV